jgi:thiol-disulfide isomerase/thioredoxin
MKASLSISFMLLLMIISVLAGCTGASDGETQRDVTFQSTDGETVELSSHEGKPVLLNFWATWCAPCRVEMPILQAYYDQHPDQFIFYAVNVGESAEMAQGYIDDREYTFPVGLDPENILADQLAVRGLPVSLIYNANGELHYRHTGGLTQEVLDEKLTPLLEQ